MVTSPSLALHYINREVAGIQLKPSFRTVQTVLGNVVIIWCLLLAREPFKAKSEEPGGATRAQSLYSLTQTHNTLITHAARTPVLYWDPVGRVRQSLPGSCIQLAVHCPMAHQREKVAELPHPRPMILITSTAPPQGGAVLDCFLERR